MCYFTVCYNSMTSDFMVSFNLNVIVFKTGMKLKRERESTKEEIRHEDLNYLDFGLFCSVIWTKTSVRRWSLSEMMLWFSWRSLSSEGNIVQSDCTIAVTMNYTFPHKYINKYHLGSICNRYKYHNWSIVIFHWMSIFLPSW